MYIIAAIFTVVVAFVGYGIYSRKKVYDEVDRLEAKKIDIMNRPINDELARVKKLNMSGETEERFERWRAKWDELITGKLPDVEEMLYEAEEAADRYRFGRAKQVNLETRRLLEEANNEIDIIRAEVEELISSEERNESDMEELRSTYRDCKQTLLARRHSYGKAEKHIEEVLDETAEQFALYDKKTEQGNYIEAASIVAKTKDLLGELTEKMDTLPDLILACTTTLPDELKELHSGCMEMKEKGYPIDEFNFEKQINEMANQVIEFRSRLDNGEISEAEQGVAEIMKKVEEIYDQLEAEVNAKQEVETGLPAIGPKLEEMNQAISHTKDETVIVQQNYRLYEELDTQKEIERKLAKLLKSYEKAVEMVKGKKVSYFRARRELKELEKALEEIKTAHLQYEEMLDALRKDERRAQETIQSLRRKLFDTTRIIQKSTIPGMPEHYIKEVEFADSSIADVNEKLDEKPLNMPGVNQLLEIAEKDVEKVHDKTLHLLEQADLAERVIQYGNRYRSRYPHVAQQLDYAERAFRDFEYETALEKAASTVEEVEPGALKRMEQWIGEYQEV
ncbi:septation ring formation regulator EzrA [Bacillus marinisedimentorum]|uniref:septation ring formation regulator EzrA n=1 Tax=Bacillus marinisedimentorum TaxID=1821260 RepID=UPI0009F2942B|nr:septation ring formation regulator EzrA [Bacillus marinisedimentorum]